VRSISSTVSGLKHCDKITLEVHSINANKSFQLWPPLIPIEFKMDFFATANAGHQNPFQIIEKKLCSSFLCNVASFKPENQELARLKASF
jgi:hypothetical protein